MTWISLFAPSATEFVIPHLQRHFELPKLNDDGRRVSVIGQGRRALLGSIGPTTATFLREKLCLDVAVVAPKPDALQLASAIAAYHAPHE